MNNDELIEEAKEALEHIQNMGEDSCLGCTIQAGTARRFLRRLLQADEALRALDQGNYPFVCSPFSVMHEEQDKGRQLLRDYLDKPIQKGGTP